MGSIIWLHGTNKHPDHFTQLWFLSLKPKVRQEKAICDYRSDNYSSLNRVG